MTAPRKKLSSGQRAVLAAPYLWIVIFFLAPMTLIAKISLSHPAETRPRGVEQRRHACLGGGVTRYGVTSDGVGDLVSRVRVEIVDDHARALGRHPDRDGAADTVSGSGHDHGRSAYLHVKHLRAAQMRPGRATPSYTKR